MDISNANANSGYTADSLAVIHKKVLALLCGDITSIEIDIWLSELSLISIDERNVLLGGANKLQRDVVIHKYLNHLRGAYSSALGLDARIFIMGENNMLFDSDADAEITYDAYLAIRGSSDAPANNCAPAASDSEYTFDSFVIGNSNRFAYAASFAVADTPAFIVGSDPKENSYNPLFIYGDSGLGKTHLLYAIMDHVRKKYQDYKVVYVKGDEFTNELISAIQKREQISFRNKYRYADLFLVDDVQFIAGKESSQEEFFHTFNTLHEAKKQIILTSDRPPKEIATLEDRLRTRFEWGLLADIQPPDFETRAAIINRKALHIGVELDADIVEFIANNIKTNIRQLEGAVKKLKAFKLLTNTDITPASARDALKDMFTELAEKRITVDLIIKEVCKYYSISEEDIKGRKKTSDVTMPRQCAMYLARELTDMSLPNIGVEFGGRDHTTVIHAVRKVEYDISRSIRRKQIINDIIKNIKDV